MGKIVGKIGIKTDFGKLVALIWGLNRKQVATFFRKKNAIFVAFGRFNLLASIKLPIPLPSLKSNITTFYYI